MKPFIFRQFPLYCRPACCFAFFIAFTCSTAIGRGQTPYLSSLAATKDSPLFTTYAAPEAMSEFTLDKAYHLLLNDEEKGADFTNESGGDICLAFKSGGKYVYALKDMFRQPVITASYSDLVTYTFWPFDSISVKATFVVYGSHHAVLAIDVRNNASNVVRVEVLPFLQNWNRTYEGVKFRKEAGAIAFTHEENPDDWVLEHGVPYVRTVKDAFVVSDPPDRMMSFRSYRKVDSIAGSDFLTGVRSPRREVSRVSGLARIVAFSCAYDLRPGETHRLTAVRSVARPADDPGRLIDTARSLTTLDLPRCIENDEKIYSSIPPLPSVDPDIQMLYWGAFSLMRQVMLPPEGKCHFNYYVFS
ncbi:MAG TPA: hypothetical protein VF514_00520, partial [Bacteroidota bacterium]